MRATIMGEADPFNHFKSMRTTIVGKADSCKHVKSTRTTIIGEADPFNPPLPPCSCMPGMGAAGMGGAGM